MKFSLIVPVHNKEGCLERCLASLSKLNSSYEVIIVDDASTDQSNKIAGEYVKKYKYYKLVELKSNKGAGAVRNIGVKHAKGDYLVFIDSDDWYQPNALTSLENIIDINNNPELIIHSYNCYANNKLLYGPQKQIENNPGLYNGKDLFNFSSQGLINPAPWNKVYKTEFWRDNNFSFAEGINHEDVAVAAYFMSKVTTAIISEQRLYNYVMNTDSGTYQVDRERIISIFRANKHLRMLFYNDDALSDIQGLDLMLNRTLFRSLAFSFKSKREYCDDANLRIWTDVFTAALDEYAVPKRFLVAYKPARLFIALLDAELRNREMNHLVMPVFGKNMTAAIVKLCKSKIFYKVIKRVGLNY